LAKKSKNTSKKETNGGNKALVILVALAALAGGVYLYLQQGKVMVPDLVGQTVSQAESALSNLKLRADARVDGTNEPASGEAKILKQAPQAGTEVPKGSVVTLFVAPAEEGIELPDVVGKTRSEAEDALLRLGLEVKFTEEESNSVPIGKVIRQDPPSGSTSLQKGDSVTLTVSGGKGEQSVPNLIELTPDVARQELKKLGFELVVMEVADPNFRPGDKATIQRQEPVAGDKLPVGSRVTVFIPIPAPVVRPGDEGTGLHAPRLEGKTIGEAREIARSANVTLELADSAEDAAVITFQDPPPGDPLRSSAATVLVRTTSSSVVPGLAGLSQNEARTKIEKAELTVGKVTKSYGPVPGEVLGQRPSPGIEVVSGSQVDLVVADPSLQPDAAVNPQPLPTPAFTPAPWVE